FVGSDAGAARKAIEKTLTAPHGRLNIDLKNAAVQVTVSDLPPLPRGDRADIIVVVTERGLTTDVKRGENHGRVLAHAPVVRYLATVGQIADGRRNRHRPGLAPGSPRRGRVRPAAARPRHSRRRVGAASERSPVNEYP